MQSKITAILFAFGAAAASFVGAQAGSLSIRAALSGALVAGLSAALKYLIVPPFAVADQAFGFGFAPTEKRKAFGWSTILTTVLTGTAQVIGAQGSIRKEDIASVVVGSVLGGVVGGTAYTRVPDEGRR